LWRFPSKLDILSTKNQGLQRVANIGGKERAGQSSEENWQSVREGIKSGNVLEACLRCALGTSIASCRRVIRTAREAGIRHLAATRKITHSSKNRTVTIHLGFLPDPYFQSESSPAGLKDDY
jgi:hypothetical protein